MGSIFLSFVYTVIAGLPIVFVLGICSVIYILATGNIDALMLVPQRLFAGIDNFALLNIPFYILAGEIMAASGITNRLVKFFKVIFGHVRGSLGHVSIAACIFFAGISGSAQADAAAIGTILHPAMKKEGYDEDFSAGLLAAGSTIGPIIPPSMIMIMYAVLANVSIAQLFLAGIIPGLVMGGLLVVLVIYFAKKYNLPKSERKSSFKEIVFGFRDSILALILPLIIIVGIVTGIFTATEAAAVAVAYALFIAVVVYKNLSINELPKICLRVGVMSAAVLMVAGTGNLFAYLLASEMIPQKIVAVMLSISSNPVIILLLINLLLYFVGTFMDTFPALIVLTPVLLPVVKSIGIDPVHFGIIMSINLSQGLITPPLGLALFVTSSVTERPIEKIVSRMWPFLISNFVALLLVTYIPSLSMFIPNLLK